MTLLERTKELKEKISIYDSDKGEEEDKKRIIEKTVECKVEREKVDQLANSTQLMAGANAIPKPFDNIEPNNKAIQDLAKKLKEHLQKDPVSASREPWAKFISKAKTASGDLRSALLLAWPTHVRNQIPNIGTYLLFKKYAKYKKSIEAMENIEEKATRWMSQLPQKEDEIDQVEEARKQILELVESLDMKNVPNEVLTFLRDCAGGTARLSDLTPKILKWLEENKFTDTLKISTSA